MSLVYEALQKAEREKDRKTGTIPAHPEPPASPAKPVTPRASAPVAPAETPAPARSHLTMLVVCVSVVALVGIVAVVLIAMKNFTSATSAAVSPVASSPPMAGASAARTEPRASDPVAPPSPGATENDPRFKLTGIMKMGDTYGAVINGHIVYQDNYVDGAVVKKVERDRVTLNLNGRETVLRLF